MTIYLPPASTQPITTNRFHYEEMLARVYAERDAYMYLADRLETTLEMHLARCQTTLDAATERHNEGDVAYWTMYVRRFHEIISE